MKLPDWMPGRRRTRLEPWLSRVTVGAAIALVGAAAALFAVRTWRQRRAAAAARAPAQHLQDLVDESSVESFPASDPPSTMSPSTVVTGEPRRP